MLIKVWIFHTFIKKRSILIRFNVDGHFFQNIRVFLKIYSHTGKINSVVSKSHLNFPLFELSGNS